MKWVYYNEWEPYCAQWLRNLMDAGHIPAGEVDERDIREVSGDDLKGYEQVHLFAGIGGWAYATRLAGYPDNYFLWSGSCPCQPFSNAGQRMDTDDPRHLWPEFHRLIAERRPAKIFGEQVASPLGRKWLAGVRADLEALGYAVGAADLCAAGVGAPQIRQRLWWVGNTSLSRERPYNGQPRPGAQSQEPVGRSSLLGGLGLANGPGSQPRQQAAEAMGYGHTAVTTGSAGFWSDFDLIPCGDGKARRVEPGTFPLAHGIPARVGKLRAYGNAIVPQVAAEFMMAARAA